MANKVRILVLGDAAVGKTSLVHWLSHSAPVKKPEPTQGCQCSVTLHDFKSNGREYYLEFWDIGGSDQFAYSRTMFYNNFNGVILVYDLTTRDTFVNLRNWLQEVVESHPVRRILSDSRDVAPRLSDVDSNGLVGARSGTRSGNSREPWWSGERGPPLLRSLYQLASNLGLAGNVEKSQNSHDMVKGPIGGLAAFLNKLKQVCPVIIIGNKTDVPRRGSKRWAKYQQEQHWRERKWIVQETGVDCLETSAITCSGDLQKMDSFFNKVIERRFLGYETNARGGSGPTTPRRLSISERDDRDSLDMSSSYISTHGYASVNGPPARPAAVSMWGAAATSSPRVSSSWHSSYASPISSVQQRPSASNLQQMFLVSAATSAAGSSSNPNTPRSSPTPPFLSEASLYSPARTPSSFL